MLSDGYIHALPPLKSSACFNFRHRTHRKKLPALSPVQKRHEMVDGLIHRIILTKSMGTLSLFLLPSLVAAIDSSLDGVAWATPQLLKRALDI